MRCILYHTQIMPPGQIVNRVHVAWLAGIVHGNDGSSLRGNTMLRVVDVHAKSQSVNIDQNGLRFEIGYDFGGGGERGRRHQDFVSLLETDCLKSQMKSCGA